MHPKIATYFADADRFSEIVAAVPDWQAPSPCEDWTAGDVVHHIIDTERDFLAQRGAGLTDLQAEPTSDGPRGRWHAHLDDVRRVVADDAMVSASYDGYFGTTTLADTLGDFYGFDLLVHRWDLGRAAGKEVAWGDAELQRIETSLDGFGETLYMEGICRPAVTVPDDASRQDRLLGRMGRQPDWSPAAR